MESPLVRSLTVLRDPMYLGAAAVILGTGLILSSPSVALLAVAFLLVMHLVVVVYEEPALESRFGAAYRRYKSSVPRWRIRRPRSGAKTPPFSPRVSS